MRPIHGVEKVLRFFAGVDGQAGERGSELRAATGQRGAGAIVVDNDGELDGVFFVTVEDDRITALHGIRNPEKLGAV